MAAAVILVQSKLVDVNTRNDYGKTPLHLAVSWNRPRMVEAMCALCEFDSVHLGYALWSSVNGFESARVLIANGARLGAVSDYYTSYITPKLEAFELAVLRCRSAVVALLHVKRVGELWRWDKFLLRELAYAVWATRCEEAWQK